MHELTLGVLEDFFLFVGGTIPDGADSKLRASNVRYRHKKLASKPDNWRIITGLLQSPELMGAIVRLTGADFRKLEGQSYTEAASELFEALGEVNHILFIHESVLAVRAKYLGGIDAESEMDGEVDLNLGKTLVGEDDDGNEMFSDEDGTIWIHVPDPYPMPSEEALAAVWDLFELHGIEPIPYQTNAELSVMATSFVEDNEKDLLFRVYVPEGRLYASEMDKLLELFGGWLAKVKGHGVRQGGYRTARGRVIELFGEDELSRQELQGELGDFTVFLDLCSKEPTAAEQQLRELGLDAATVTELVGRYARENKRLHLDLRHARESKLLSLRQGLEAELSEEDVDAPQWSEILTIIDSLVPGASSTQQVLAPEHSIPSLVAPATAKIDNVVINQQIVHKVEGSVIQGVEGSVNLNAEATELLSLIRAFGNGDPRLETAVHELEDEEAGSADRLKARQRLKGFMVRVAGHVEELTVRAIVSYLENRLS